MLFSDADIKILSLAHWTSDAQRSFEIMSGGFVWSDEQLKEISFQSLSAVRYVISYRASLIRGVPRDELSQPWKQLRTDCPDWPGFHPDRCNSSLAQELDQASRKACRELLAIDREFSESKTQK